MKRIWWLALALALLLAGCGLVKKEASGRVVGTAALEDGGLEAIAVRTAEGDDVVFEVTEDTQIFSWTDEVDEEAFRAGEAKDTEVAVTGLWRGTGYVAREIEISGARRPEGLTLSDGTGVEIWDSAFFGTSYILPDGTELLRENRPSGPQNVHVGGVESFEQLPAPAQEAVAAYYEEQGLLYDVEEVLERAYADYRDGGDFSTYLVEQTVSPSGSNDRLMYFTTTVFASVDSSIADETSLSAAFDRETGEKLDTWSLFAVPEAEARAALVDRMAEGGWIPRAELEAALRPEYIIFRSDGLNLTFPRGTLPSQEYATGGSFAYAELDGLLQPWAVPEEPEQER